MVGRYHDTPSYAHKSGSRRSVQPVPPHQEEPLRAASQDCGDMSGRIHEMTVDNITTTNTLEVWRDKLHREKR